VKLVVSKVNVLKNNQAQPEKEKTSNINPQT